MGNFSIKSALAILSLVCMWGFSWPIYKVALSFSPPLLFGGMRTLLGGLLVALFLIPHWKKIMWRKNWRRYCISALLNTVLFFGLQTVGLLYLPGGLFSVLVYFQPVLIGLFSWMWLGERMSILKIGGLIVGFLGILAVSTDGFTGEISMTGVIIALLSAVSWAIGVIYVKKERDQVDAMWMVSLPNIIGGAVLILVGSGIEKWSKVVWNGTYVFGLGYGAIFGIAISFVIYFKLINAGEASKVASFTFLVPLIAVLAGTLFLNEPFTYTLLMGLILIVISILLVNFSKLEPVKQLE